MRNRKLVLDVVNKRDGRCMYGLLHGGCSEGLDPHHIVTRGAGGDDVPENIITLCRRHHNDAHAGKISKYELYGILTEFYNYQYE
jgi:5-methylcytosine-specific restriction endonuclease McrA